MKRALPAFVLSLALCAPRGAWAAPGDAPAAEGLFRDGRAAFDRGDFETARTRFAESQRLDPAPGTLLNLAMAEQKLGELSHAWEHAKGALDALPAGDNRAALAKKLFDDLDRRVPRLKLVLASSAPRGSRIVRDDVELREGSLGVPLPVDRGRHVVVVSAPGRADARFEVTAKEGAVETLEVAPGPTSSPDAPRERARTRTPVAGFVLGGAGVVGLALGGVAGVMVLKKKSDVDAHCDGARVCDDAAFDAASQGKTWSTVSTVSFAAGAVLTGVGLYLVLASTSSGEPSASASLAPGGASASFRF